MSNEAYSLLKSEYNSIPLCEIKRWGQALDLAGETCEIEAYFMAIKVAVLPVPEHLRDKLQYIVREASISRKETVKDLKEKIASAMVLDWEVRYSV